MDVIDGFAQLFRGRLDAYGVAGDQPYADKVWTTPEGAWTHEVAMVEYHRRIACHLNGTMPMGVYPLMDSLHVMWGCTDLDGGESDLEVALNIQTMFAAVGVTAWIERSRSKGFHVWVFAAEPCPADVMRNAFLAVHQRLEVPAREVNPKQATLEQLQAGLGNWVRTPYPGGLATPINPTARTPQTVVFQNPIGALVTFPLGVFVEEALANRTDVDVLREVASRYVPPPPRRHVVDTEGTPPDVVELAKKLTGAAYAFYADGSRDPSSDRSTNLQRFAYLLNEHEPPFTPSEAFALLTEADRRHGQKFYVRADGPQRLMDMIGRAYG